MSTRYFVVSYNSIFFNYSYNVSTIYHPLRSYRRKVCSEKIKLISWTIAAVLLLPQASVVKGPVRVCVCVYVCVMHSIAQECNVHLQWDRAIIDDTPTASLMLNAGFHSDLRATSLTTLGCCGREGITDARTDLRLRRTYLHYAGNTRPTYRYAWVSWNVVPCYTFDFQRCLQWQMRSTRDDATQFDHRDRREILHFL